MTIDPPHLGQIQRLGEWLASETSGSFFGPVAQPSN